MTLRRGHSLACIVEGDTKEDLMDRLRQMIVQLDRNELTTGVGGGSHSGTIYQYLHDPSMTHDTYFAEIERRIKAGEAA